MDGQSDWGNHARRFPLPSGIRLPVYLEPVSIIAKVYKPDPSIDKLRTGETGSFGAFLREAGVSTRVPGECA